MEKDFLNAHDVAELAGISLSGAYKVIRTLNGELEKKGYYTFSGRVAARYFYERVCYGGRE